jgi:CheY-like chemotaxis protein
MPASKFNMLLIDDSEAEAKLVELALLDAAPRVRLYWVASAEEGLQYLRQEGRFVDMGPVSIVICDLNMPGASGFDFISRVKKSPALMTMPLIVYSASESPRDIHRAYSLGANSYLVKAMTLETMARQLASVVTYWLETVRVVNGIGSAHALEYDAGASSELPKVTT